MRNLNSVAARLGNYVFNHDRIVQDAWDLFETNNIKLMNAENGKEIEDVVKFAEILTHKNVVLYPGIKNKMENYLKGLIGAEIFVKNEPNYSEIKNWTPYLYNKFVHSPHLLTHITEVQPLQQPQPSITISISLPQQAPAISQNVVSEDEATLNNLLYFIGKKVREDSSLKDQLYAALSIAMAEPTHDFTEVSPIVKYSLDIFESLKSKSSKELVLDQVGRM